MSARCALSGNCLLATCSLVLGTLRCSETGVFLGGKMDLPMTMHQAAVKMCMSEDVDDGTKFGFVARFLLITLLEFCIMSAMSWDRGCTTHDQCKQGVSACWDFAGNGYKPVSYTHLTLPTILLV